MCKLMPNMAAAIMKEEEMYSGNIMGQNGYDDPNDSIDFPQIERGNTGMDYLYDDRTDSLASHIGNDRKYSALFDEDDGGRKGSSTSIGSLPPRIPMEPPESRKPGDGGGFGCGDGDCSIF